MVMQDRTFPSELRTAEKVMVILVPQKNGMSGGTFSLFSIAGQLRKLRREHGYEVVVMTLPSREGQTYFRNTNFQNSENIYRFSQIRLLESAREIYLMIPEYAVEYFCRAIAPEQVEFLKSRTLVRVNICNQNINLMPDRELLNRLREIAGIVTQTVAHHAYFSQEVADKYGLPTLLLPAYTDLSAYPPSSFGEKEKLIIYSPDDAPYKNLCLSEIARNMPDYDLVEIRGITFDRFMDLATRCRYSITFGEGFDGYLAQPIYQGGIGFAVYNKEFFPSDDFLKYQNIFSNPDELIENVCGLMRSLEADEKSYCELNRMLLSEYQRLYSFDEYVESIRKLSLHQFDYYPSAT